MRWLSPICLAWLLAALTAFGASEAEPKRVLLIHSFGRDFAPFSAFAGMLRMELANQLAEPVDFFETSLESARFNEPSEEGPLVDYLQAQFAARRLDLVVPIGGAAVRFAQRHRQRLFPATPMLIAATDQRHLNVTSLTTNDTAVAVAYDPAVTVETILHLLPGTTNLVVVIGNSPLEQFWVGELREALRAFTNRVGLTWFNELPFAEILKRSAKLPPRTAIYFPLLCVDAAGVPHLEERALGRLSAVANAPVFGFGDPQLGWGIVGGPLMEIEVLSRKTAKVAVRILRGEHPNDIQTPPQAPGTPVFDWRELERWNISESRLPPGSIVRFRQPTAWELYRGRFIGILSLCLVEGVLIALLVRTVAQRRRAEQAAHDLSGRLLRAQEEERARLAKELHDGLSQNLALLSVELEIFGQRLPGQAAQVNTRLSEFSQQTKALSAEVHRISRGLHPAKLTQLGLEVALKSHCREVAAAHGLSVKFDAEAVPRGLPEDLALCLYRVAQEAIQNVIKHSGAQNVQVTLSVDRGTIELNVKDDGKGFVAEAKCAAGSLGLVSMQERVRLVRGEISVESKPGAGTRVKVGIPLPHGIEP